MPLSVTLSQNLGPILGALRSVPVPPKPGQLAPPAKVDPFVTISRQVGAGAWPLAQKLADALSEAFPDEQRWTVWDRELVEKVAADHHLARRLVEAFEEQDRSWLADFFAAMGSADAGHYTDEMRVYRDVASTARALAQTGRVVLVGRGSVFITHQMPGGVHVRLVAPLQNRVAHMAETLKVSHDEAARHVRELTKRREQFYHRFWPKDPLTPELFHLTINTGVVSADAAVAMIREVVRDAIKAAV